MPPTTDNTEQDRFIKHWRGYQGIGGFKKHHASQKQGRSGGCARILPTLSLLGCAVILMGCNDVGTVSFPQVVNTLKMNTGVVAARAECHTMPNQFLALGATFCVTEVTVAPSCEVPDPAQLYNLLLQDAWSLSVMGQFKTRVVHTFGIDLGYLHTDGIRARVVHGENVREDWVKAALPGLQKNLVSGNLAGQTSIIRNVGDGTVLAGRQEAKQKYGTWPSEPAVWPKNLIICQPAS